MASASGPKVHKPSENGRLLAKVTPVPVPKPGSIPSLPPSAAQAAAAARNAGTNTSPTAASASGTGFGVLKPAEAGLLPDVAVGIQKDGRIRNPVPSKLKGKTDGGSGTFSVMHMELSAEGDPRSVRDAEAKKTSERTEMAAKRAFEGGWVSYSKRSKLLNIEDEPVPEPYVPPASAGDVTKPYVPGGTSMSSSKSNPGARRTPLTAAETKAEQARLLTLLRSLHPILVVDQICKALAFFGGIPGAPPPSSGIFPNSAEANGSGSLFVGWIAEIFPKLGNLGQPELNPTKDLDNSQPVKRKRGRPKGSKSTKVRIDKGLKKGASTPGASSSHPTIDGQADQSWVDVEDEAVEEGDDVDANVMLLAQATLATSPQPTGQESQQIQPSLTAYPNQLTSASARTALPASTANDESTTEVTPKKKGRGRPAGSKNRPKAQAPSTGLEPVAPSSQAVHSLQVSHAGQPTATGDSYTNQSFTAVNSAKSPVAKKKGPRAKAVQSTGAAAGVNSSGPNPGNSQSNVSAQVSITPVINYIDAHRAPQAVSLSSQPSRGSSSAHATASFNNPTTASAPLTASTPAKRKRKSGKNAEETPKSLNATDTSSIQAPSPQVNGGLTLPTPPSHQSSRLEVTKVANDPPAPKRQRKNNKKQVNDISSAVAASAPVTAAPAPVAPLPSPVSVPAPAPTQPPPSSASAMAQESAHLTVDQPLTSTSSPHHTHFEVQSPTMENYEAQLQAQLEQEAEPQPQPSQTQSRVDSRHLASDRTQQHTQYLQVQQQAQQSQQQPRQPVSQHHSAITQSRSPNPLPQATTPQTTSPLISQQTRVSRNHYSSYRPSNSQYSQQSYSPQQSQSPQVQQQTHQTQQSSSQLNTQTAQSQQYSNPTTQPQYSSSQSSYSNTSHYPSVVQPQASSQPRYQQQLNTTSAGTNSYSASHSPQYASIPTTSFGTADGAYRNATSGLGTSSYGTQRSQSSTPAASNGYRATSTAHGLSQHSTNAYSTPQPQQTQQPQQRSTSGTGGLGSLQHYGSGNDWGLFDPSSMDNSSGHTAAIAMNTAGYGLNSGGVARAPGTNSAFSTGSMTGTGYDGLSRNDQYHYGVGRR